MDKSLLTYQDLADKLGYKLNTIRKYYYLGKNMPERLILPTGRKVITLESYDNWKNKSSIK